MSFIVFVRQPKNINSSEKVRFVQYHCTSLTFSEEFICLSCCNLSVFNSLQNYVKPGTDRITDWSSHIPDHKKYRHKIYHFSNNKFIFVGRMRCNSLAWNYLSCVLGVDLKHFVNMFSQFKFSDCSFHLVSAVGMAQT